MITLGVEEEYLLLDPCSGYPVPSATEVRAAAGLNRALDHGEVQHELLLVQLEVSTPVCRGLDEIGGHLLRLRHALGTAAEKVGCRIAAAGTAPFCLDGRAPVTDTPRYRSLYESAPQLVDEQLINGMHVHVGVPDRGAGVQALNHLTGWLPVLVALGANSPLWRGRDTGFASWRTIACGRWPVSGAPPHFADAADYERRVQALVVGGAIRDTGQIYWQARLSERYPTIEVRAADVQLRVDEAVMIAGLVRALVLTSLNEPRDFGGPAGQTGPAGLAGQTGPAGRGDYGSAERLPEPEAVKAAGWHAARYGLGSTLFGASGRRVPAHEAVFELVDHVRPALKELGDEQQVCALVERTLRHGNGGTRQLRALAGGGAPGLVQMLLDETTEDADRLW